MLSQSNFISDILLLAVFDASILSYVCLESAYLLSLRDCAWWPEAAHASAPQDYDHVVESELSAPVFDSPFSGFRRSLPEISIPLLSRQVLNARRLATIADTSMSESPIIGTFSDCVENRVELCSPVQIPSMSINRGNQGNSEVNDILGIPFFDRWGSKSEICGIVASWLQPSKLECFKPTVSKTIPCAFFTEDESLPVLQCEMPLAALFVDKPIFPHVLLEKSISKDIERDIRTAACDLDPMGRTRRAQTDLWDMRPYWSQIESISMSNSLQSEGLSRPSWRFLPPTLTDPTSLPSRCTLSQKSRAELCTLFQALLTGMESRQQTSQLMDVLSASADPSSHLAKMLSLRRNPGTGFLEAVAALLPQLTSPGSLNWRRMTFAKSKDCWSDMKCLGGLRTDQYENPERTKEIFAQQPIYRRGVRPPKDRANSAGNFSRVGNALGNAECLDVGDSLEMFDLDLNACEPQTLGHGGGDLVFDAFGKYVGTKTVGNQNGSKKIPKENKGSKDLPEDSDNVSIPARKGQDSLDQASRVSLVVPRSLVISKHAMDTAEACLRVARSFVLLPPPLSFLPSLVALVSTFLQCGVNSTNNKVLVLCPGLVASEITHVYNFVSTALDPRLVTHIVDENRIDGDGNRGGNEKLKNARLLISSTLVPISTHLGSFPFAMIAVLIQSSLSSPDGMPALQNLRHYVDSSLSLNQLRHIRHVVPNVVATPYPSCLDFKNVAFGIQVSNSIFGIDSCILRNPLMDSNISASVSMAQPSHLHIVLSPDSEKAVQVLEEGSFTLVQSFWNARRQQGLEAKDSVVVPPSLATIDILDIHRDLLHARRSGPRSSMCQQRNIVELVVLNILKRCFMFSVNENVTRALQFLSQAAEKCESTVLEDTMSRLQEIVCQHNRDKCAGEEISTFHRVLCVKDLLKVELVKFDQEDKSIASSRIQKGWCALIVAESGKTADALLSLLDGADDVENLGKPSALEGANVFVAHISQLKTSRDSVVAALKFFANFSHIIHMQDSTSMQPDSALPVPVEMLVHSDALRLIRISVDVSRGIEDATNSAHAHFNRLSKVFISQTDKISTKDVLAVIDKNITAKRKSSESLQMVMDLAVGILARSTENEIARLLFAKLREMDHCSKLSLRVHVPPGVATHPTVLTLHEVIMSHTVLQERVDVSYEMGQRDGSIPAGQAFRPKKRMRGEHSEWSLIEPV